MPCVCVSLADLEVRLKDGTHRCEGRVEVKHQGEWGTVNDHNWRLEEAQVVCRQLGCGAATDALRGAHFGPGIGPIWFRYTYCHGLESVLTACTYPVPKDYHPEGLSHDQDAGAVCSSKSCLVCEGIPIRKSPSLIPRVTMRLWITEFRFSSVQFSLVTQSCPTLCNPMNRRMPGLPVHHQLPEFLQIHIHRVSDAIQPSHPLSSPSPPAPNPSQHQGLFQ